MTFVLVSQFHIYLPCFSTSFALCLNLNVKALVGTFNKEKVLVGAFLCDSKIFANLRLKL